MKSGDTVRGQTVELVLGDSNRVAVYTTNDRQLRWNYNGGEVPSTMQPAIVRFNDLMSQISSRVPQPYRSDAYIQLGKALFSALDGNDATQIQETFRPVAGRIDHLAKQDARQTYMIAFLISIASLAVLTTTLGMVLTNEYTRQLLQGAAAGVLGAAISILQRSGEIEVDPLAGKTLLRIQGAARGFLGGLFGVFIVLAVRGDVVFGFVRDHAQAMYPMAVAAGFSERLVPELLARLENTP